MRTIKSEIKKENGWNYSFCACCGNAKGAEKNWFYFNYNHRTKVCKICQKKFDSSDKLIEFLEANAIFNKGTLLGFKHLNFSKKQTLQKNNQNSRQEISSPAGLPLKQKEARE